MSSVRYVLLEIVDGKEARFVNIGDRLFPIWLSEETAAVLTAQQRREVKRVKVSEMIGIHIGATRCERLNIPEKNKLFPGNYLSDKEVLSILFEIEEQKKIALEAKLQKKLTPLSKEEQEYSLNLEKDAYKMIVPYVKPKHDYCLGCKITQTCDENNPHCKVASA